mmetsp:Transcript_49579/g.121714  ORF Transcript_49579/g.121714 Transcript_49579/m.121714 type:complete len:230 (+) Transcript_49579:1097-1786(+)
MGGDVPSQPPTNTMPSVLSASTAIRQSAPRPWSRLQLYVVVQSSAFVVVSTSKSLAKQHDCVWLKQSLRAASALLSAIVIEIERSPSHWPLMVAVPAACAASHVVATAVVLLLQALGRQQAASSAQSSACAMSNVTSKSPSPHRSRLAIVPLPSAATHRSAAALLFTQSCAACEPQLTTTVPPLAASVATTSSRPRPMSMQQHCASTTHAASVSAASPIDSVAATDRRP